MTGPLPQRPPLPGLPADLAADPDISAFAKLAYSAVLSGVGSNGLCVVPLHELRARVAATDRCFRDALRQLVSAGWLAEMPYPGKVTAWIVHATAAPYATVTESDDPGSRCHGLPSATSANPQEPWPSDPYDESTVAPDAAPRARAATAATTPTNSIQTPGPAAAAATSRVTARGKPERKRQPLPENFEPDPAVVAAVVAMRAAAGKPPINVLVLTIKFRDHYARSGEWNADWQGKWRWWAEREEVAAPAVAAAAPGGARADDAAGGYRPSTKSGQRLAELDRQMRERAHG